MISCNENNTFAFRYVYYIDAKTFDHNKNNLIFYQNIDDAINKEKPFYYIHDLGMMWYDYGVLFIKENNNIQSIWLVKVNNNIETDIIKNNLIKIWDVNVGYLINFF